jgi:Flp pilus assembly protein TadD
MKKSIATSVMGAVIVCTTVFLLSACTLFQGNEGRKWTASSQQSSVYRGKVGIRSSESKDHYSMGCVFQERNKHRLAVTEFETAVQMDPDNAAAYNGMGISLDTLGEYIKAQAAYLAALAINPDRSDVLNNLGYSYLLQSRPELAIACFAKALALGEENELYRNNLAMAYARTGNHEAAFQMFLAVADKAEAYFNMGRLYYREGDYDQAAFHFSRAANLKPADTDTIKAFAAASTLAQIHDAGQNSNEKEAPIAITQTSVQTARYDNDGFTTIPAGAIEEPVIVEVDRVGMAEATIDSGNHDGRPIYTITLAQVAEPLQELVDTRATLDANTRKILDESQAREVLGSRAKAPTQRPENRIRIEVSNGNGVRHMARNVGNYLSGKGFILMYLANADHFNHVGTSIYYTREYLDEAYRLSQELPGLQTLEEVPVVRDGNAEISVLIGRDLTEYLSLFEQC